MTIVFASANIRAHIHWPNITTVTSSSIICGGFLKWWVPQIFQPSWMTMTASTESHGDLGVLPWLKKPPCFKDFKGKKTLLRLHHFWHFHDHRLRRRQLQKRFHGRCLRFRWQRRLTGGRPLLHGAIGPYSKMLDQPTIWDSSVPIISREKSWKATSTQVHREKNEPTHQRLVYNTLSPAAKPPWKDKAIPVRAESGAIQNPVFHQLMHLNRSFALPEKQQ